MQNFSKDNYFDHSNITILNIRFKNTRFGNRTEKNLPINLVQKKLPEIDENIFRTEKKKKLLYSVLQ